MQPVNETLELLQQTQATLIDRGYSCCVTMFSSAWCLTLSHPEADNSYMLTAEDENALDNLRRIHQERENIFGVSYH
ncbi:hypothetical protein VCR14J2_380135 [Vibrio coralliirubri]|uniref:hypothetical protein n=1 Tax=Vibrio coralliirubri TaxID=1516159 RepID=UPI000639FEC6|nr:hypothetical protein [Vibrio coralliirubri]CDU04659.1 hypothetical protein VCR14J2_380135 [Vibrio coralliirubri]